MKLRPALVFAVAACAAAGVAQAAPVGASTSAQVNIVSANQITVARNLQFGSVAKPTSGTNTVKVASAATDTATPDVTGGGNGFVPTGGQAHAATFHIVGTPGQAYTVSANTLDFAGAGSNLTGVGAEAPVAASGTLNTMPGNGQDDLHIGGHFDITPTTAVQTYNGTLSLTVNFN